MRPLKNNILVVDTGEATNTTSGGIILQSEVDKGSSKPGFVIAVGPDVEFINPTDKIALDWGKGLPVTVEGEKAILISEDFVRGVY